MGLNDIIKQRAKIQEQIDQHQEEAQVAQSSLEKVVELKYQDYKLVRQALEEEQTQLNEFEAQFTRNSSQEDCVPINLKVVIGGSLSTHKIELDLSWKGTKESTSLRGIAPQIGMLIISAKREFIQNELSKLQADNVSANRYQEELWAANRKFAADPNNQ